MDKYPIISQTVYKNTEGVKDLSYPDLLSPHFCWAVVGAPGSGKTTFIQ